MNYNWKICSLNYYNFPTLLFFHSIVFHLLNFFFIHFSLFLGKIRLKPGCDALQSLESEVNGLLGKVRENCGKEALGERIGVMSSILILFFTSFLSSFSCYPLSPRKLREPPYSYLSLPLPLSLPNVLVLLQIHFKFRISQLFCNTFRCTKSPKCPTLYGSVRF